MSKRLSMKLLWKLAAEYTQESRNIRKEVSEPKAVFDFLHFVEESLKQSQPK